MRLFVAFDIDDRTRAQLAAARDALDAACRTARVPPRVTWVNPDIAHVTVRFIGETPDEHVARIQDALGSLVIQPFDVTWGTIGTFGGARHPRVLWVGATTGVAELTALATDVNGALDGLLGPGEDRAFKAHITLGRVRDGGRGVDWERALSTFSWQQTVTRVSAVTLYRSRLSPKGPTYTALSTHG
jgi:2'-5' RNA ligase